VLTASTVMVGPPDFSTTRSPDLKTVICGIHDQQIRSARVTTSNADTLWQSANQSDARIPGEAAAIAPIYFNLD
jgi:hypothetical protein